MFQFKTQVLGLEMFSYLGTEHIKYHYLKHLVFFINSYVYSSEQISFLVSERFGLDSGPAFYKLYDSCLYLPLKGVSIEGDKKYKTLSTVSAHSTC